MYPRFFGALSLARVRREAEQVFVEKETSEIILDSISDAVIATDAEGYIRYVNPVAAQLTGWPQPQASGRHYSDIFQLRNPMHKSENDPIGTCLAQDRLIILTEGHVLRARDGTEMVRSTGRCDTMPIVDEWEGGVDGWNRTTGSLGCPKARIMAMLEKRVTRSVRLAKP